MLGGIILWFVAPLCLICLIPGMKIAWLTLVQVLGRLNPFPVNTRRGVSASLGVLFVLIEGALASMALPLRDDQYISLTPTDSPAEDAEMDSGEAPLGHAEQEGSLHERRGLTRMLLLQSLQVQKE